ncbi:hypothetical protein [Microvirga sp. KLBC 81]|uniref:hypothetical protein n=1 Tax=Microvirga sp. KLBC 81 TaxID=1862707 RepID=UPI001403B44E|nr:hypothetical protein [Microvirga sp. KLBC 81]
MEAAVKAIAEVRAMAGMEEKEVEAKVMETADATEATATAKEILEELAIKPARIAIAEQAAVALVVREVRV